MIMKYILKKDITVKIPHFKSILIIKAGSKCVPLTRSNRGTIFMVQPFFLEDKDDEWIRQFGHKINKKDTIIVEHTNDNTVLSMETINNSLKNGLDKNTQPTIWNGIINNIECTALETV